MKTYLIIISVLIFPVPFLFSQSHLPCTYNLEDILISFPESKLIEISLNEFERKLMEKLSIKPVCYPVNDSVLIANYPEEYEKLLLEKEALFQKAEMELLYKRQELLRPLIQQVSAEIYIIADNWGCLFIEEFSTFHGFSIDITENVLEKMQVDRSGNKKPGH